jgi:superfamily II DNA or RNA helicase
MDLKYGVYEQIINEAISEALESFAEDSVEKREIEKEEGPAILAKYMQKALEYGLNIIKERTRSQKGGDKQINSEIKACNEILHLLSEITNEKEILKWRIGKKGEQLYSIWNKLVEESKRKNRPNTSLSISSLLTGSNKELSFSEELSREIQTADEIDFLVSFIKHTGIIKIFKELEDFTSSGGRLRIITTTYMGVTDDYAINKLSKLPNTEIKISYDSTNTRLHAKSYIFKRSNEFTTAFVGSSNLSGVALTDGMEWNLKVTNQDMPHIISAMDAAFESYWNSKDFEIFDWEKDNAKLKGALKNNKIKIVKESSTDNRLEYSIVKIEPYPFQEEILRKLEADRAHGRRRNLVVSATGTGKTIISAIDYRRYISKNQGKKNRLLFIAHRKEILERSLVTFRMVLQNRNFGELLTGDEVPQNYDHLFATIQSLKKIYDHVAEDYFDYIVVDEVHHGAADSYERPLTYFKPDILLGLTATPERMDGQDITRFFDDTIATELRLSEAIDRSLLVPFNYYGVTDLVDISQMKFQRGRYDTAELEKLYVGNKMRMNAVINAINDYRPNVDEIKGLGFCVSIDHAEYMANEFNDAGIPSIALTSRSPQEVRETAQTKLVNGEIKFIFSVDLYNEGVDIPQVNTELMLRPTESMTIFIQQLGRGLRKSEGKEELLVLDFIGQAHKNYTMNERKLEYLTAASSKTVSAKIKQGFSGLPQGCFIKLEPVAKEYILENLKNTVLNRNLLTKYARSFEPDSGERINLSGFMRFYDLKPKSIYSKITFTGLKRFAGLSEVPFDEKEDERFKKGLFKLSDVNSRRWIEAIKRILSGTYDLEDSVEIKYATMLYYSFYSTPVKETGFNDIWDFIESLRANKDYCMEIKELMSILCETIPYDNEKIDLGFEHTLDLHCEYTLNQLLSAIGKTTPDYVYPLREGVRYFEDLQADLFFVTLDKTEKDYSPTTMYRDYALNEKLFHWQSQNETSVDSSTGRRYIEHERKRSKVLLFLREGKKDQYGKTVPYTFLGRMDYVSHEGERPMSIKWELENPMPSWVLEKSMIIRS